MIATRTTIGVPRDTCEPRPRPAAAGRRRLRAALEQLSPETIEAIAHRVAQLLQQEHATRPAHRLVDADELARQLGLTRGWVYQHARELGAIRLGDGPKARLRFDPAAAAKALSDPDDRPAQAAPRRSAATRGRPRREPAPATPLLPIRGQHASTGVPARASRRNRQGGPI